MVPGLVPVFLAFLIYNKVSKYSYTDSEFCPLSKVIELNH